MFFIMTVVSKFFENGIDLVEGLDFRRAIVPFHFVNLQQGF